MVVRTAPAKSVSLPSPTEGWDARSAIADMPPKRAVILDNWFPNEPKVTLRRGFTAHVTGLPATIESLLNYTPPSGGDKLFAASNGAIYDVTSAGAVGAAVATGYSNDRWQQVQLGTSGGQYLFMVNGEDDPQIYDGSTWANASISASGLTPASLVWCNLHQRRLWFGEEGTLVAWYLAVNAISGTPNSFSIGLQATKGGYIVAMGTWTRDGGNGPDDVAVFITSEGQAVLYEGIDPASASTWGLVGVFDIGKPIGRRSMIRAGADLIIVTQDGFVPCSAIMTLDRSQSERVALSSQIAPAVNDAVRDYGSTFGWQPILYPRGQMLIVNIPQANSTFNQYVFNTLSGAPCRFTGVNAICWALLNDEPYFAAADGTVYRFDFGMSDNGAEIAGDALQAFNYFRTPGQVKGFKMVEPIFESTGSPGAAIDLNLDFQIQTPTGQPLDQPTDSALWGVGLWGIGTWGTSGQIFKGWRGVRGFGRAAAIRVRVNSTTTRPSWLATNWIYIPGGQLF